MGSNRTLGNKSILVVGGNGFIGRHVVRQLTAEGAQTSVMDVTAAPSEFRQIDWVVGNYTDAPLLASAASGCDTVIFLANSSLPGSANTDLSSEVQAHVYATIKAAEICDAQGVHRFVFASSGGTVYGVSSDTPLCEEDKTSPRNAYGVSKLAIEHYLRIISTFRSMQTISLRISNPYGEGQRAHRSQGFVAAAMQHAVTGKSMSIWGDGSVERDFIYVGDVARAFAAACTADMPPSKINIGSGQACSLLQVLQLVEEATGQKVQVEFEAGRNIDVHRNVLSIDRARDSLGWSPKVSLQEGIASTAKWWSERER